MLCAAAWICRFHSLRPTGRIGQVGVELFTRSDQVDWVGSAWVKSLKPNCEKDDPVHTLHLNSEKSVTLHFLLVTPGQAQGYIASTHPPTHTHNLTQKSYRQALSYKKDYKKHALIVRGKFRRTKQFLIVLLPQKPWPLEQSGIIH